jgi:hypothetical protein
MIEPNVAYSRPLAAVRALGEDAGDPTRFLEGRVLLASEEGVIQTSNGRVMALTALRLLPRVFANVSVLTRNLPEALVNELKAEAARIAFGNEVTFVDNDTDPGIRFDAALSIGRCELPELRFIGNRTAIAANGWVVWVQKSRRRRQ